MTATVCWFADSLGGLCPSCVCGLPSTKCLGFLAKCLGFLAECSGFLAKCLGFLFFLAAKEKNASFERCKSVGDLWDQHGSTTLNYCRIGDNFLTMVSIPGILGGPCHIRKYATTFKPASSLEIKHHSTPIQITVPIRKQTKQSILPMSLRVITSVWHEGILLAEWLQIVSSISTRGLTGWNRVDCTW